ncbi:MAG: thioredoxin domain-containing protein [Bacteroidia bacterium]|nr:thioredoxin domain-containing protein [Bacteroidia bacterium]
MANLLIHESSPYLLQHAHNPVNWRAWNEETIHIAQSQDKLLLISIGYSSCHWCHVMERECFENEEAARIMNKYFICVKVDREERPDIDAIYMQAIQMMTGHGGWPLNCFALPDGRPFYGSTYFPLEQWISTLENIYDLFKHKKSDLETYADRLTKGIIQNQLFVQDSLYSKHQTNDVLKNSISKQKQLFDDINGGMNRAPKFPMPVYYSFLLHYALQNNDEALKKFVFNTLEKMSWGGIFDQIGGGFARYSTDIYWKVPHFEKMLYDNAQLVSLYSVAYRFNPNNNYKESIVKTIRFITSVFDNKKGGYFSAIDADSEGQEGKFYIWSQEELKNLLPADEYEIFARYYNVNNTGHWEHNNYILLRTQNDEEFCKKEKIELRILIDLKEKWHYLLNNSRNKRIWPEIDDKTISSWNALMLSAFVDAFKALNQKEYLNKAIALYHFIIANQWQDNGKLWHSYKNGKSSINGFLEDYALCAFSFIKLYEATGNVQILLRAKDLLEYALQHFYDPNDGLFYFTENSGERLVARTKETMDDVIPSSNSVMGHVLFMLGIYFEEEKYTQMAERMCSNFYKEIESYGSSFSNWALLLMRIHAPLVQIAVPEKHYEQTIIDTENKQSVLFYYPYCLKNNSVLPFVEDKADSADKYFLCIEKTCNLPYHSKNDLMDAMKINNY